MPPTLLITTYDTRIARERQGGPRALLEGERACGQTTDTVGNIRTRPFHERLCRRIQASLVVAAAAARNSFKLATAKSSASTSRFTPGICLVFRSQ